MQEALGSIPGTAQTECGGAHFEVMDHLGEKRQEDQKFKASQSYTTLS